MSFGTQESTQANVPAKSSGQDKFLTNKANAYQGSPGIKPWKNSWQHQVSAEETTAYSDNQFLSSFQAQPVQPFRGNPFRFQNHQAVPEITSFQPQIFQLRPDMGMTNALAQNTPLNPTASVVKGSQPSPINQNWREILLNVPAVKSPNPYAKLPYFQAQARSMVSGPNALITRDGYVVIGDQAYSPAEAYEKALEDIAHVRRTGRHLPPLPYPTSPLMPRSWYPDVTEKVEGKLAQIRAEVKVVPIIEIRNWFSENFDNTQKWDLQVGHKLPGQIVLKDDRGFFIQDQNRQVLTQDQYALFRGKIQRAGYISNFTFGYATAAIGFPWIIVEIIVQGKSLLDRHHDDSPQDILAIRDGWEAYWFDYPNELKPFF